jgi:ribonuclease P protein subunit RPR2
LTEREEKRKMSRKSRRRGRRKGKRSRSEARRIATEQVLQTLDKALDLAKADITEAERKAKKARNVGLKFNVRLPYSYRLLFCHGCKEFIVPGITSRVRLQAGGVVTHVCLKCGHIYRKFYTKTKPPIPFPSPARSAQSTRLLKPK